LFAAAEDALMNAKTAGLSPAWSFNIAYSAALNLCSLVVAAEGYRLVLGKKTRDLTTF
jgi:hypothetical protein